MTVYRIPLHELEKEVAEAVKEVDSMERAWLRSKIERPDLTPRYFAAYLKAGLRLSKLRQHRNLAANRDVTSC